MRLRAFEPGSSSVCSQLQHIHYAVNIVRSRFLCTQCQQQQQQQQKEKEKEKSGKPDRWTQPRIRWRNEALIAQNSRIGSRRYTALLTTSIRRERMFATSQNGQKADLGPMKEYDNRVSSGRLRDDNHQRDIDPALDIIQSLQHLHDELSDYDAPRVIHPSIGALQPKQKSIISRLFGGRERTKVIRGIPENLPRGLYLYGDVGSGKTMLMDMFYETLPTSVKSKTRIHFHNFMQDVHRRLHKMNIEHGNDIDGIPFVAADIAEQGNVLCFDEFQCTDVADAMILRRLLEALMSHGVVLVTTSNRHPDDLYKNGIQRDSFVPCINLLKARLHVINLDSPIDYRKIPRPPSGVYHSPLDAHAASHAEKWFRFLGDHHHDSRGQPPPQPHAETQRVWGREIRVPRVSGRAAMFSFDELIGRATGAADYLELARRYDSFVVTGVPGMTHRERDLARRFITFIDAVYDSRAKLVLTSAVPLTQLFMSRQEVEEGLQRDKGAAARFRGSTKDGSGDGGKGRGDTDADEGDLDGAMRNLMDDLGMNMDMLKNSSIFSGDEEKFAFVRAISRLSEMGSKEWVERGMGLEKHGGEAEKVSWQKERSQRLEEKKSDN